MLSLSKIFLFSAPVLFFCVYLVMSSQKTHEVKIEKESLIMDKQVMEFEKDFTKDPERKKEIAGDIAGKNKEIVALKDKEKERERKEAEIEKAMDEALKESEKDLKKRVDRIK